MHAMNQTLHTGDLSYPKDVLFNIKRVKMFFLILRELQG